ncbi:hypothetical protein ACA910_000312 [Epithemia clementina (nom. ined.)]
MDNDDDDLEEWENHKPTPTTWSTTRPPRRTFASKHRRAVSSVVALTSSTKRNTHTTTARKVLPLGGRGGTSTTTTKQKTESLPEEDKNESTAQLKQPLLQSKTSWQQRTFGRSCSLGASVSTAASRANAPLSPSIPNFPSLAFGRRQQRCLAREMSSCSSSLDDDGEAAEAPAQLPPTRRVSAAAVMTPGAIASMERNVSRPGSDNGSYSGSRRRRMLGYQPKSQTLPPLGPSSGASSSLMMHNKPLQQPQRLSPPPRYMRSFSLGSPTLSNSNTRGFPPVPPLWNGGEGLDFLEDPLVDDRQVLSPPSPPLRRSWTSSSNPTIVAIGENSHPNFWNPEDDNNDEQEEEDGADEEPLDGKRGRKKMRARRASIQGVIPSLSELSMLQKHSSGSMTARVTSPHPFSIPPRPGTSTKSLSACLSPCNNHDKRRSVSAELSVGDFVSSLGGGSPSTSSRASSGRKRGVCGSPIVDSMTDDLSSNTGLSISINSCGSSLSVRRRSRSRIFSPPTTPSTQQQQPQPPLSNLSLPVSLNPSLMMLQQHAHRKLSQKSSSSSSSSHRRQVTLQTVHNLDEECRGMDGCSSSSDDDSEASVPHPNDMSLVTEECHPVPVITVSTDKSNDGSKPEQSQGSRDVNILATMSSYDDFKFLIRELRNESKRNEKGFMCGRGNASWTVSPPTAWHSQRRTAFFHWALQQFQFTLRPLGNAVNALQISKARGQVVLATLEEALITYKEQGLEASPKAVLRDAPSFMYSDAAPLTVQKSNSTMGSPSITMDRSPVVAFIEQEDVGTSELAADMQSLSLVKTNENRKSDVSLEVGVDYVETVASNGDLRPSFEHSVVGVTNLMLHLHGDEEDDEEDDDDDGRVHNNQRRMYGRTDSNGDVSVEELVKLPKLSISSTTTGRLSAPHPIQNLEVIETPQIKPDEGWGSCPIPGKDWGTSAACSDEVLDELSEQFDEACRVAGIRDSTGGLPFMPSGLDMEEEDEEDFVADVEMAEDQDDRMARRRKEVSMAKRNRMSLWARASQHEVPLLPPPAAFNNTRRTAMVTSTSAAEEISTLRHEYRGSFPTITLSLSRDSLSSKTTEPQQQQQAAIMNEDLLVKVLAFVDEPFLLCTASLVCTTWATAATAAHAAYMMASVGYHNLVESEDDHADDDHADDDEDDGISPAQRVPRSSAMDRNWKYLTSMFPWACFLSSGAYKRVFKVYNSVAKGEEAISVMDVDAIVDKKTVASELVVSAMLSAIARRGICPNFVIVHGVFTLPYDVPESHWGCENVKRPKGSRFVAHKKQGRPPRQPRDALSPGRYQFIRMELCSDGDLEEYIKGQDAGCLPTEIAQASLFQIAFALHTAADRCSLKHYDTKLLNVFVQRVKKIQTEAARAQDVVLRYGLGSHVFALRLPSESAFFAKLADYGTANIQAETTGKPVTIAQFTTLENTPPDFMILGDAAKQGHGHDNFGLGLCMLHLFTGHAPYEEILEEVVCPPLLKKKLRKIWENDGVDDYSVIRSVILSDVYKDERGHIVEGEPDETLYDTLYRYLVLFGIPEDRFEQRKCPAVWKAISEALEGKKTGGRRPKQGTDMAQYEKDLQKYSIRWGTNAYIARARRSLEAMHGGMDLLFQLCSFNPETRATALQVLNSPFMEPLREAADTRQDDYKNELVLSYTAFSTCTYSS